MSRYRREFENENGENKTIYVKRPDNDSIKEADIHRAKVWNKAFKEGVMTKKEVHWEYCGICYYFKHPYPFGYCKECWIKAGCPKPMKSETFIEEAEPD